MRLSSIVVSAILLSVAVPQIGSAKDQGPTLKQALGAAYLAKAELALLKGQSNTGKVCLAAAHEANPGISLFRLKALDMMYKDFPHLDDVVPGYHGGPAAFSMDGRFVAYSTRDNVLRLDLETGELKSVGRPRMHALRIEISPKGRFVATCDNMGNLALCDMKRETQVGQFSLRKEEPRGLTSIRMSFSLDENSIVAYYPYSDVKAVHFLSTTDLSVIRTVAGITMGIGPIQFLADGSLLACPRARTALVDPSTMKTIKTLAPRTGFDVDYLPSKNLLAVGSSGRIEVFDSTTQERVTEYQAASHNIVLVRFLGDGQYIAYASPKGESGIIDCNSGKPIQVFNVGRDAAVCPSRYLLLAQGRVIDLSACRPSQANLNAKMPHATRPDGSAIPAAVLDAMSSTSGRAMSRSGMSITLVLRSDSDALEAYGTRDGRTFIYDRGKDQVHVYVTDRYRNPTDFAIFPDGSHFVRLCASGNGQVGAVEVYSLPDGSRHTLRFNDPPVSTAIAPDLRVAAVLDRKNRVSLTVLPSLDTIVELLPATMTRRQISVDQDAKTLMVKTGSDIACYDLGKVSEDRALPTYEEAVRRYGVSADVFEPTFYQPATPARVELPEGKHVTSGTSTIDTAKAIVSRSAVDLKASQSTGLSRERDDAPPDDRSDSHSCHLTPVHNIMGSMVRYYRPMRITLSDQPSEDLHKEPEYRVEKPLYGTMQLGDGKDRFVTIVVDEPEDGPARVYIDRNNDEDLTNDGDGGWSGSSSSSLRLSNVRIEVDYTTGQMPYTFSFYRFKTRLRDVVLYYRDSARQGEIVSSGQKYKIVVLDENADGRFDDLDNGTLLIDLNQDGKLVGGIDSAERHELGKPLNIHGKAWSVDTISANGSMMALKPSTAEVEMRTYLEPGYPAPAFSGKDLEGNSIELSKEAGSAKYVLLDFWASWCGPCRKEFPYLRRLHAGYKDRGLRVLGVNMDSDRDAARQVAQENGLDYPHVFDGLGWKNAVAVQYRVTGIPQTYLLDSNLNIVAKNLRGASLERKIATLLGPANNEAINAMETKPVESLSPRGEAAWPQPYINMNSEAISRFHALIRNRSLIELEGELNEWLSDHPTDTRTPVLAASLLETTQEPNCLQVAERIMRTTTSNNPDSAFALRQLGIIVDRLHKYDEAIELYRQTLVLNPNDVLAMNNLAWLLSENKSEYPEALELAQRALAMAPDYADLLDTHGAVCLHLHRFSEAKKSLESAVRLQRPGTPSYVIANFHLAQAYEALDDTHEAGKFYEKSLTLNARFGGLTPEQLHHAQNQAKLTNPEPSDAQMRSDEVSSTPDEKRADAWAVYDRVDHTTILNAIFTTHRVNGSNNENNQLAPGSVFFCKTNEGRLCKFLVEQYGYNLVLSWTTYNRNGEIYSDGSKLRIRGTWSCDLDQGKESKDGADFFWQQVTESERYLSPRNGAMFAKLASNET